MPEEKTKFHPVEEMLRDLEKDMSEFEETGDNSLYLEPEELEELKELYFKEIDPLESNQRNNLLKMRVKRILYNLGLIIPNKVKENPQYKERVEKGLSKSIRDFTVSKKDKSEFIIG